MGRGYAAIGLVGIKNAHNFGGALRAAHCFGAQMIAIQGNRLPYAPANTTKAERHIPVLRGDDVTAFTPFSCRRVAIEIVDGASSLVDFAHPERAFYIFGPEDGSVSKDVLAKCHDVISIPTAYCLNLAATVNVVLYDRLAKQMARREMAA